MTLAQHLPVYKASYDLTLSLFLVIKKFPKEFKYTLGEQLKKDCLMLISSLYKTNTLLHKKESLIETRATLEGIRVLLRLSKDLHIIAVERFVVLSESIETISKQLLAWERKSQSWYEGGG